MINANLQNIRVKDEIVYDTDQYLSLALEMCPQQVVIISIIQNILKKCKYQIIMDLQQNSESRLNIISIQSYLRLRQRRLNHASIQYYKGLQCLTGIRVYFEGNPQIQPLRIYHKIHDLLKKHPISMLELTTSELTMFQKYYKTLQHIQYKRFDKIYIFFYSKYNTADIKDHLSKKQYSIAEQDLENIDVPHKKGQLISLIHQNQKYFRQFIQKKKYIKYYHMKINKDSISFLSNQQNYQKIIQNVADFLKTFSDELEKIAIFRSQFQQQVFFRFYASKMKKVSLLRSKNQIAWKSLIYEPDQIDTQISQIYNKMNKSMILIPSSVELRNLPKHMRLQYNPIITSIISLKYKIYQVNSTLKVIIRNFGSVYQNEGTALFLIHKLERCQQFCKALQENDISPITFKQMTKGKSGVKYDQYVTSKSKNFNSVIGWPVDVEQKNANRVIRDLGLLFKQRFKDDQHVKIIVPQDSQELVKYAFPLIFDELFSVSNLHTDIIKTIDIIVNFEKQKQIVQHLRLFFIELVKKSNKVKPYNPLYINQFNIQKIIQYKYVTCLIRSSIQKEDKSFEDLTFNNSQHSNKQDITESLSAMCSFLLYSQLFLNRKYIQRTIIASTKYKRSPKAFDLFQMDVINMQINTQFVIDWYSKKVISISNEKIKQHKYDLLHENLHKICKILTDFIQNIDSFVIFGNEEGSVVNNQFYIVKMQKNGTFSRIMNKIIINMQKEKIILQKNKQYKFDLIINNDKPRFLIETAKKSKQQAILLLNKTKGRTKL